MSEITSRVDVWFGVSAVSGLPPVLPEPAEAFGCFRVAGGSPPVSGMIPTNCDTYHYTYHLIHHWGDHGSKWPAETFIVTNPDVPIRTTVIVWGIAVEPTESHRNNSRPGDNASSSPFVTPVTVYVPVGSSGAFTSWLVPEMTKLRPDSGPTMPWPSIHWLGRRPVGADPVAGNLGAPPRQGPRPDLLSRRSVSAFGIPAFEIYSTITCPYIHGWGAQM